jgi:hypothetical protein
MPLKSFTITGMGRNPVPRSCVASFNHTVVGDMSMNLVGLIYMRMNGIKQTSAGNGTRDGKPCRIAKPLRIAEPYLWSRDTPLSNNGESASVSNYR